MLEINLNVRFEVNGDAYFSINGAIRFFFPRSNVYSPNPSAFHKTFKINSQ